MPKNQGTVAVNGCPLPQGRFGERAARANRHFAIRRQIRPNRPAYPGRISIGSIKPLAPATRDEVDAYSRRKVVCAGRF